MNAGDHHLRATPLAAAAAFLEAMYDVVARRLRFVVTFLFQTITTQLFTQII
jgi:hypothetical protein